MSRTRWNNNEDYYNDIEEDTLYQNALTLVRVIEENKMLRMENEKLKREIEEDRDYLNKQYQNSMKHTGNILSMLIDNAEKK